MFNSDQLYRLSRHSCYKKEIQQYVTISIYKPILFTVG